MHLSSASWSIPLIITAVIASTGAGSLARTVENRPVRGVAYFESPKSVGTPIDDVARGYTGHGLAAKIAGRLRLDTDASLDPVMRDLIRQRLVQVK